VTHRLDAAIAATLLVVGTAVALFVGRHYTGSPQFYQEEFGPAVMVAQSRGFVEPVVVPGSSLDDFLHRRHPDLQAAGDPGIARLTAPNALQESSRYLMLAVGWWWKVTGISWRAVWAVSALLFGMSAAACYAVFRQWASRLLSAAGALFMCLSPVQLTEMPNVRDYAKAPFIIAGLCLVAVVALRPLSRRSLIVLSGLCGAVVGIGFGFRPDVEIVAPLFLAGVTLFRSSRPWTGLADKALAAGTFTIVFAIAAGPVLVRVWGGRSNPYHVLLLGYTEPFDGTLRLTPSVYGFGFAYSDAQVEEVVSGFSQRIAGRPASYPSAEYNSASRIYWMQILRHFPADVLTRGVAAASGVLNLPFQNRGPDFLNAAMPGAAVTDPVFRLLRRFDNLGLIAGLGLIGLACAASWRHGLFAVAMLVALFGIASLEFERRHFFYLQFVPLLAMIAFADAAARWLLDTLNRSFDRSQAIVGVKRLAAGMVVIAAFVPASIATARRYQTSHLRGLFSEYVAAPRTSVAPGFADLNGDVSLARWSDMTGAAATRSARSHAYYALEFEWTADPTLVAIGVRYRSRLPPDVSSVQTLVARRGTNRVFFPAYGNPGQLEFDGLEIPSPVRAGLGGLYRLDDPDRLPLPLELRLAADWRNDVLYETVRLEGSHRGHDLRFVDAVDRVTRIGWVSRLATPAMTPRADALAEPAAHGVDVSAERIAVDAVVDAPSSRVSTFRPLRVGQGSALVAYGRVDSGGVAVGLLKDGRWYRSVEITDRGNFVAILDVPDTGVYAPAVAHAAPRALWRNRFLIYRFGVADATVNRAPDGAAR
jgi:hypothetical protein